MSAIRQFIKADDWVDMVEYALLAGLLSLACLVVVESAGLSIGSMFTKLSTKLSQVLP